MYTGILRDISKKIAVLNKQISELQKEVDDYNEGYLAINKLQKEYNKEKRKLAVQKGVCPFPDICNEADSCTLDHCNEDN